METCEVCSNTLKGNEGEGPFRTRIPHMTVHTLNTVNTYYLLFRLNTWVLKFFLYSGGDYVPPPLETKVSTSVSQLWLYIRPPREH